MDKSDDKMQRFEDLGRKLFQVPKEELDDEAEGVSEEESQDDE